MLLLALDLLRRRRAPEPARLVADNLAAIERLAERAARRGGFTGADVEDFVSEVKLRLLEDDGAVLRKHRGKSSLLSYLAVVIQHHFQDHRNRLWGKYRPSASARRQGADAVLLEKMVVRDGLETETAIEMMRRNHGCALEPERLREIAAALPARVGKAARREVGDGEETLARIADGGVDGVEARLESRLENRAREATVEEVERAFAEVFAELEAEDRLMLRMHLGDGFTLTRIAALLGVERRALYSRKDRCLAALRRAFEARGLTWERVREILGWSGSALHLDLGGGGSGSDSGPGGGNSAAESVS